MSRPAAAEPPPALSHAAITGKSPEELARLLEGDATEAARLPGVRVPAYARHDATISWNINPGCGPYHHRIADREALNACQPASHRCPTGKRCASRNTFSLPWPA